VAFCEREAQPAAALDPYPGDSGEPIASAGIAGGGTGRVGKGERAVGFKQEFAGGCMIVLLLLLVAVTLGCALDWHDQPAPRGKDNC
jgi:hypothetical protein